jgi:WD40 repeat protein
MRLAYELLDQGDAVHARSLLEPYEPPSPQARWRGFEWHHLKRRLHPERLSLAGHRGEVYRAVFSPDGRVLATGGQDGAIKLWDAASGKDLATLNGHTSCVNDLVYAPDGQQLWSASCDHTIRVWRPDTSELLATLVTHQREVLCLALAGDGKHLASGDRAGTVAVWDVPTRTVIMTADTGGMDVDFLAWRDARTIIYQAKADNGKAQLVVWHLDTHEREFTDPGPGARLVIASPDGRDLVQGSPDGTIAAIGGLSAQTGHMNGRGFGVRSLAFAPGGSQIAAGFDDATVQIWDWPPNGPPRVLAGHTGLVQSVAFAPDGNQLATASFDGTVRLWDFQHESSPRIETRIVIAASQPGPIWALSADCKKVAIGRKPDEIALFDIDDRRLLATRVLPERAGALNVSTDASSVFCCSEMLSSVWRWDWRDDQLGTIASDMPLLRGLAGVSRDGRHLIGFDLAGEPRMLDTQVKSLIWRATGDITTSHQRLCFSPDGMTCAVSATTTLPGEDGKPRAWILDVQSQRVESTSIIEIDAISNRGALAAHTDPDRSAAIVDRATGRDVCHVTYPTAVRAWAFAPDGRTLAGYDVNGRVLQWHVATGQLISNFETCAGKQIGLRYSIDGRRLAAIALADYQQDIQGSHGTCKLFLWSAGDGR